VSEAVRCQFCMAVLSEVGSDTWDGEHKDWCPVVERES
jgi:phage FluMu protein Com